MPKVDFVLPQLEKWRPIWDRIDACVEGEDAVKEGKAKYLPKPTGELDSRYLNERYESYLQRARFYNVTGRTLDGLLGMVFRRDASVDLPTHLAAYEGDLDGNGTTLEQQARRVLSLVLKHGTCGLMADFPALGDGEAATLADIQSGLIRPRVFEVPAKAITNYRSITVGGQSMLGMIVIRETAVIDDDGFESMIEPRWRELRLTQQGVTVTVWRKKDKVTGNGDDFEIVTGPEFINDWSGRPMDRIPFVFAGAINNDSEPDKPPLLDIANLNIGHYINSAEYEESCHLVGQPTPYFTGITEDWIENVWKGVIKMGSRAAVSLPEGATAGLLQADPNTMAGEAMRAKEAQMLALGAQLIEPGRVQKTATEAGIEHMAETSVLGAIAKNVSSAYNQILTFGGMFLADTDPESIDVELNTDFETMLMTPQGRQQLLAEYQGGLITLTEARRKLRQADIATDDDDVARAEIDAGGLDDDDDGTDAI